MPVLTESQLVNIHRGYCLSQKDPTKHIDLETFKSIVQFTEPYTVDTYLDSCVSELTTNENPSMEEKDYIKNFLIRMIGTPPIAWQYFQEGYTNSENEVVPEGEVVVQGSSRPVSSYGNGCKAKPLHCLFSALPDFE